MGRVIFFIMSVVLATIALRLISKPKNDKETKRKVTTDENGIEVVTIEYGEDELIFKIVLIVLAIVFLILSVR